MQKTTFNSIPISFKQPDKKKIEDEERRQRLREVLEKRRAKSTDPKDISSRCGRVVTDFDWEAKTR